MLHLRVSVHGDMGVSPVHRPLPIGPMGPRVLWVETPRPADDRVTISPSRSEHEDEHDLVAA